MSQTTYPVNQYGQLLFRSQSTPTLLINSGSATIYLGENSSVSPLFSIPMATGSSYKWDEGKDLWAICNPNQQSYLIASSNASNSPLAPTSVTVNVDSSSTTGLAGEIDGGSAFTTADRYDGGTAMFRDLTTPSVLNGGGAS